MSPPADQPTSFPEPSRVLEHQPQDRPPVAPEETGHSPAPPSVSAPTAESPDAATAAGTVPSQETAAAHEDAASHEVVGPDPNAETQPPSVSGRDPAAHQGADAHQDAGAQSAGRVEDRSGDGDPSPGQDPMSHEDAAAPTGAPETTSATAHAAGAAPEPESAAPEARKSRSKRKNKGKKPDGRPDLRPQDVVARIGDTNEQALAYALAPDAQLSRMSRKVRDTLITDLPPVTAGALLGPAALARHLIASAASGRYRDLFALWELFRQRPGECKPILAERPQALDRARGGLATAVRLGLSGRADRVAADIQAAEGLIWQWLRETLIQALPAVGRRPAIASALLRREPDLQVPLPDHPDEQWLTEAAAARMEAPLAPPVERILAANADRLPATVATLALAQEHYPERVPALIERVDLDSPEIGSLLAWARDHGYGEQLRGRARRLVEESAQHDRAEALARWQAWQERGVDLPLPEPLLVHSLEGLDIGRPETAVLVARLVADGAAIDPQAELDALSLRNRQLAEKAYEAFVCAGLNVTLPKPLAQNPIVRDGTRCPHCLAWTWVRPGHERRCPQRSAEPGLAATSTGPTAYGTTPHPMIAEPGAGAPSVERPTDAASQHVSG